MTRPRVTARLRATAFEEAALILQVEASNPGVVTAETLQSSLGIDPKRSRGIVLSALAVSSRTDMREWFAEAECIVRCHAAGKGTR